MRRAFKNSRKENNYLKYPLGLAVAFIRKYFPSQIDEKNSQEFLLSFIVTKGNSKLGDALVNFVYSLAKSAVSKQATGTKVSDYVLATAYRSSLWGKNEILKLKGKKGYLADHVESLILYFWVYELVSFEELFEYLAIDLSPEKLHHSREEEQIAVLSFRNLLNKLHSIFLESQQ
jgi:hypothetical protein